MIGYILLGIAIFTYIIELRKISLMIFFSFMLNGWCVLTDDVLGSKNYDLALIYIGFNLAYSTLFEKKPPRIPDMKLRFWLVLFLLFMLLDILFSLKHYQFTTYQVIQGCRASFLFLSYYILKDVDRKDFIWVNQFFFYITLVTSVLYVFEVLFDWHLLPYDYDNVKIDDFTGIKRYYNSPPLLYWFIFVTILTPKQLKSYFSFPGIFILVIALIATLGRTQIAMTGIVLALGLLIQHKAKSMLLVTFVTLVLYIPFSGIIGLRFAGKYEKSTESEIKSIFSGGIQETAYNGNTNDVGTLTYRFAWIYERASYLANRPFAENLMGLGLISDSQTITVHQRYNFLLGLPDQDGDTTQMTTPDISYGNLFSKYGYLGSFIYLSIWFYLLFFFIHNKRDNDYSFLGLLIVLEMLLLSFSGTSTSDQGNLIYPFMVYLLVNYKKLEKSRQGFLTSKPQDV